jgi:hypothetical protein
MMSIDNFLQPSEGQSRPPCNLAIRYRRAHAVGVCPKRNQNRILNGLILKEVSRFLKKERRPCFSMKNIL